MKKRLLCIILCITLAVGLLPLQSSAYESDCLLEISDEGVLTWDAFGTSDSYTIELTEYNDGSGLLLRISDISATSYALKDRMNKEKLESGTYFVCVNTTTDKYPINSEHLCYYYVSPLPKLSEPQNLRWNGNSAVWDSVPGATGYSVSLYDTNGGYVYSSKKTTDTHYTFGTSFNDGRWFTVSATADGYRNSNVAESPKNGTSSHDEKISGGDKSAWNLQMSTAGVLSWNPNGDTGLYEIVVSEYEGSGTVLRITDISSTSFDLKSKMDEKKIETDKYSVNVFTHKNGFAINSETAWYSFVSSLPKLAEPKNLRWDGSVAMWDSVPGATGYSVSLLRGNGCYQYSGKKTTVNSYDFQQNTDNGYWFTVTATADNYRDSNEAESPKVAKIGITSVNMKMSLSRGNVLSSVIAAPENAQVSYYRWYKDGEFVDKASVITNGEYYAEITLIPDDEYCFTDNVEIKTNGKKCEVTLVSSGGVCVNCTTPVFTVKDDEITSLTASGTIASGDTLNQSGPITLPASKEVEEVYYIYDFNGKTVKDGTVVNYGDYDCCLQVYSKDGYIFSKGTAITYEGNKYYPETVSNDGRWAWFYLPTVHVDCVHSAKSYQHSDLKHWRTCSVCGAKYNEAAHDYTSSQSGDTITYTCKTCGFTKTGKVADERTELYYIDMDLGTAFVGESLPGSAELNYARIDSIDTTKYYDFATVQSVVYSTIGDVFKNEETTVTVTLKAKGNYKFKSSTIASAGFQYTRQSCSASSDGETLTVVFTVTPYSPVDVTLTLPEFTVGKTYAEIAEETGFTVNGEKADNYSISVKKSGDSSSITGTVSGGKASEMYLSVNTILSDTEYIFSASMNGINLKSKSPKTLTVTNPSVGVITDSYVDSVYNSVEVYVTYVTDNGGKNMTNPALTVAEPVAGGTPATSASGTGHFTVGTPLWSGSPSKFAANTSYTVTLTLTPDAGYTFDANACVSVNGYPAASAKNGDKLTVTYTFPATNKIAQNIKFKQSSVKVPYDGTVHNTCAANTVVTYSVISGGDVAGVNASTGDVTIKKTGSAIIKACAAESDSYASGEATYVLTVTKASGSAAPSCSFSFDGGNAGKLIGATTAMEYTLNSGVNWNDCTKNIALNTANISSEADIRVRVKGTENIEAGKIQVINITKAAVPSGVTADSCTESANNNGRLNGVTAAMEYKKSDATGYTACSGTTVTGLVPGTYYVRYKAAGTVMASEIFCIAIGAYNTSTNMDDNNFVDVNSGDYFYDAVLWAVQNGITNGIDSTHFGPNYSCTRAQAVTFLWRAAGSPQPKTGDCRFDDVNSGEYYYNAILWAIENGITDGTGKNTFSPNATCTRAQIVTFLYRFEGTPSVSAENIFDDVNSGEYYYNAVLWAIENGITDGTSKNTFSPNATCTRAQIVTFLYRDMGKL